MSDVRRYMKMAANKAAGGLPRHFLLGVIGVRSDGAIVTSYNGPTNTPTRTVHAEYRVSKKLDVGSTVYVARILRRGGFAAAKPCVRCESALRSRGVRRVYYTQDNSEIGVLRFD